MPSRGQITLEHKTQAHGQRCQLLEGKFKKQGPEFIKLYCNLEIKTGWHFIIATPAEVRPFGEGTLQRPPSNTKPLYPYTLLLLPQLTVSGFLLSIFFILRPYSNAIASKKASKILLIKLTFFALFLHHSARLPSYLRVWAVSVEADGSLCPSPAEGPVHSTAPQREPYCGLVCRPTLKVCRECGKLIPRPGAFSSVCIFKRKIAGEKRKKEVLFKALLISWLCQTQLFLIFLSGEVILKRKSIIRSGKPYSLPAGCRLIGELPGNTQVVGTKQDPEQGGLCSTEGLGGLCVTCPPHSHSRTPFL